MRRDTRKDPEPEIYKLILRLEYSVYRRLMRASGKRDKSPSDIVSSLITRHLPYAAIESHDRYCDEEEAE